MGVSCQIFIQQPREGVHKAGKPVTGIVKYAVDEPTEYKEIIISLVGKGICRWNESRRTSRGRRTVTYTGTEVYTAQYLNVHNKVPGSKLILPVGSYEYPFRFILPKNIPPSFENRTCRIRYKIVLKFIKPQLFSIRKKFDAEINVYSYVNPTSPEGQTSFGLQKTLFKPFQKRTHQIDLKVDISNIIFSPGENIGFTYQVTNDTDVTIPSVKAELICYTTYTANCGRRKRKNKVIRECTVETPSVPDNAVANMANTMPTLAHLYSIQHCNIMVKKYAVKVTVRLPIPHLNASAKMPVVIGEKDRVDDIQRAVEEIGEQPPTYFEVMMEDKSHETDWDASTSGVVYSQK